MPLSSHRQFEQALAFTVESVERTMGRLLPSGDILAPKVEALATDLLDGPAREDVRKRAATWVETRVRLGLSELMDARATAELPAGARGVVFQLSESLGVLSRRPIEDQLAQLGDDDRKALARLGVRVGVYSIYFPSMLKPVPIRLRAGLWMVARNRETIPPLPAEGRTSMDLPRDAERDFYATIGYLPLGNPAIRADMVERLAAMARQAVRESREAARRAQQEKKPAPSPAPAPAMPDATPSATASADEISEWAIVAAARTSARTSAHAAHATPAARKAEPVVGMAKAGTSAVFFMV
jgi:ATP-dependent RNA helicase SUPV3L1/SUV3